MGHLVQRRKVLPPPPKLSCNNKNKARNNIDKLQFAENALTNLRQRIFGYKRDISQTGYVFIEWRKPLFIRVLSASNVLQNASAKKTLKKIEKRC